MLDIDHIEHFRRAMGDPLHIAQLGITSNEVVLSGFCVGVKAILSPL